MILAVASSLAASALLLAAGSFSLRYLQFSQEYARNLQESCRLAWYLDIAYNPRCPELQQQGSSSDYDVETLAVFIGICMVLAGLCSLIIYYQRHRTDDAAKDLPSGDTVITVQGSGERVITIQQSGDGVIEVQQSGDGVKVQQSGDRVKVQQSGKGVIEVQQSEKGVIPGTEEGVIHGSGKCVITLKTEKEVLKVLLHTRREEEGDGCSPNM